MLENYIRYCKNSMGDNLLSISGEVLITPSSGKNKVVLNTFDRKPLKDTVQKIQNTYSFIDISVSNGLMDICIKIFANEARIANKNFLDDFNTDLMELVKTVVNIQGLNVRVNIFGTLMTPEKKISYRYLNKKDDVRYVIVDEEQQKQVKKYLRPIIYVPILAILILAYCSYLGYTKLMEKKVEEQAQTPPAVVQEKQDDAKPL